MNGAAREGSCRDEGGLLLLLLSTEKKSEGYGEGRGRIFIEKKNITYNNKRTLLDNISKNKKLTLVGR